MKNAGEQARGLSRGGLVFALIAGCLVVFDQITKYLAVAHLTRAFEGAAGFGDKLSRFLWMRHPVRGADVTLIENFWDFRYVQNPGSAWGFLAGSASWFRVPFFLLVSAAAMVFIIVYFRRTPRHQWLLRLALPLVFGGALGNFLDRARLGYVIDFIDWHWYAHSWPTFNIADAGITVGVSLMILDMLLHRAPTVAPGPSRQGAE